MFITSLATSPPRPHARERPQYYYLEKAGKLIQRYDGGIQRWRRNVLHHEHRSPFHERSTRAPRITAFSSIKNIPRRELDNKNAFSFLIRKKGDTSFPFPAVQLLKVSTRQDTFVSLSKREDSRRLCFSFRRAVEM